LPPRKRGSCSSNRRTSLCIHEQCQSCLPRWIGGVGRIADGFGTLRRCPVRASGLLRRRTRRVSLSASALHGSVRHAVRASWQREARVVTVWIGLRMLRQTLPSQSNLDQKIALGFVAGGYCKVRIALRFSAISVRVRNSAAQDPPSRPRVLPETQNPATDNRTRAR
jgi:hypothetical protein